MPSSDTEGKCDGKMGTLLKKGYAGRVEHTGPEGKTWYLPHQPVFNPHKPERTKIVLTVQPCSREHH